MTRQRRAQRHTPPAASASNVNLLSLLEILINSIRRESCVTHTHSDATDESENRFCVHMCARLWCLCLWLGSVINWRYNGIHAFAIKSHAANAVIYSIHNIVYANELPRHSITHAHKCVNWLYRSQVTTFNFSLSQKIIWIRPSIDIAYVFLIDTHRIHFKIICIYGSSASCVCKCETEMMMVFRCSPRAEQVAWWWTAQKTRRSGCRGVCNIASRESCLTRRMDDCKKKEAVFVTFLESHRDGSYTGWFCFR